MLQKLITKVFEKRLLVSLIARFFERPMDALIIISMLYAAGFVYGGPWSLMQTTAGIVAVVVYFIISELSGVYRSYREEELVSRVARVCAIWIISFTILVVIAFLTKTSEQFSRINSTLWFLFAGIALSAWHGFVGASLRILRATGYNRRKAAVVGVTEMSISLSKNIASRPWMGIELVGHYEERDSVRLPQVPEFLGAYLGNYRQLVEAAKRGEMDIIYISLPMRAEFRINHLIEQLGKTTVSVYIAHSFAGFNLLPSNGAPRWNKLGNISILGVVESPFHGVLGWIKQLEDMVLGAILLTMVAIPMLFIALIIRLTSKGPILFKQTRYGLNGQPIEVLKFRTMTVCENGPNLKQATQNDSRVTKFGRFLRRTSMDELPQFLQVMTGKMSIVGPRPHAVAQNEQYRELLEYYMVRHKVKPGITGWAQVNGWRGETNTDEKMRKRLQYDLLYIRNWSLFLDIKIIFLTVFSKKTHRNAY